MSPWCRRCRKKQHYFWLLGGSPPNLVKLLNPHVCPSICPKLCVIFYLQLEIYIHVRQNLPAKFIWSDPSDNRVLVLLVTTPWTSVRRCFVDRQDQQALFNLTAATLSALSSTLFKVHSSPKHPDLLCDHTNATALRQVSLIHTIWEYMGPGGKHFPLQRMKERWRRKETEDSYLGLWKREAWKATEKKKRRLTEEERRVSACLSVVLQDKKTTQTLKKRMSKKAIKTWEERRNHLKEKRKIKQGRMKTNNKEKLVQFSITGKNLTSKAGRQWSNQCWESCFIWPKEK